MMARFRVPVARAASTKSCSLSERNSARTMRARYIQLVRPMIKMMTTTLPLKLRPSSWMSGMRPPNVLAMISSRKSAGMLSQASVMRISRLSMTLP